MRINKPSCCHQEMSRYSKLDTTDNVDFGSFEENGQRDDFMIDDNDDLFITPDDNVNTGSASKAAPQRAMDSNGGEGQSSAKANEPFFNLSSFITPQLPSIVQIETRERPFTGGNTLDESVLTTLHRDFSNIKDKLMSVLWPLRLRNSLINVKKLSGRFTNANNDIEDIVDSTHSDDAEYSSETMSKIRDWDLWGPLVFNLAFSLIITYLQSKRIGNTNNETSSEIFSAAFTLIWASLSILSINIQLLSPVQQKLDNGGLTGGIIGLSFFQCISLLSYSLFPIIFGGFLSIFVKYKFVKLLINLLMLSWSLLCTWLILAIVTNCKKLGKNILSNFNELSDSELTDGDKRIFLMIYPVFLVFGLFSWFLTIV